MTDPVGPGEPAILDRQLQDALCRAFLHNAANGDNAANSELIHELRSVIHVLQHAKRPAELGPNRPDEYGPDWPFSGPPAQA